LLSIPNSCQLASLPYLLPAIPSYRQPPVRQPICRPSHRLASWPAYYPYCPPSACPHSPLSASPFAGHPKGLPVGLPTIPTAHSPPVRHPPVRRTAHLPAIPNTCLPACLPSLQPAARMSVQPLVRLFSAHPGLLPPTPMSSCIVFTNLLVSRFWGLHTVGIGIVVLLIFQFNQCRNVLHTIFRRVYLIEAWCNLFITPSLLPPPTIL
jgi:hypothetical protein